MCTRWASSSASETGPRRNACVTWLEPPVAASRPTIAATAATTAEPAEHDATDGEADVVHPRREHAEGGHQDDDPAAVRAGMAPADGDEREREDGSDPPAARAAPPPPARRSAAPSRSGSPPRRSVRRRPAARRSPRASSPRARPRRRPGTRRRARASAHGKAPRTAASAKHAPIVSAEQRHGDHPRLGDRDRREEERAREDGGSGQQPGAAEVLRAEGEGEERAAEHRADEDQRRPQPHVVRVRQPPVELREMGGGAARRGSSGSWASCRRRARVRSGRCRRSRRARGSAWSGT